MSKQVSQQIKISLLAFTSFNNSEWWCPKRHLRLAFHETNDNRMHVVSDLKPIPPRIPSTRTEKHDGV